MCGSWTSIEIWKSPSTYKKWKVNWLILNKWQFKFFVSKSDDAWNIDYFRIICSLVRCEFKLIIISYDCDLKLVWIFFFILTPLCTAHWPVIYKYLLQLGNIEKIRLRSSLNNQIDSHFEVFKSRRVNLIAIIRTFWEISFFSKGLIGLTSVSILQLVVGQKR